MKKIRIMSILLCLVILGLSKGAVKTASAESGVAITEANFPDKVFRTYIQDNLDVNKDNILNETEINTVKELQIQNKGISSLKGIEYFTSLQELACTNNKLTDLDLRKNPKIELVFCSSNQLKSLDVSGNPYLEILNCSDNELTDLMLDNNPRLYIVYCQHNPLSEIDISHNPELIEAYTEGEYDEFEGAGARYAIYNYYTDEIVFVIKGIQIDTQDVIYSKPLSIATQPKSVTVPAGDTAKFTVKASRSRAKYQWYYRNSPTDTWKASTSASGKTAAYSFTAKESANGHQYRCKVTSCHSTIYTNIVTLKVVPKITEQPESVTTDSGKTVTFKVSASGTNLKYQWYYRNSASDSWKASTSTSGKTPVYSFTSKLSQGGHQYRCGITNAGGTVYTNTVTLKVRPVITAQPDNVTVPIGNTVTFTVKASGNDLSYQWYYRNSSTDSWKISSIPSGKTASYTFTAKENAGGHQYRCAVKSCGVTVYTRAVTLQVTPKITQQPRSVTVSKGNVVVLTVMAEGSNLSYQWYYRNSSTDSWKKSTLDCGKTIAYFFTATSSHNGHQYRCAVSNKFGATYTNTVTVKVN